MRGQLSAPVDLPLGFGDPHEEFNVFDRNPAGQDFHYVLKIRFQYYITHAIYESSRCGMEHVKALTKSAGVFLRALSRGGGRSARRVLGISKEHEDIPNTKLGWEGDRVVEERQVPPGTVGCGWNPHFVL